MNNNKNPWAWVPTLYFAEGLPFVMVMTVSVIMYKGLGLSNADITFYTSWLYFPWVIKPFWSPFIDIIKTKRWWIVSTQLIIGVGFACIAFTIPSNQFVQYTLAFFWLIAFSSATHDIAADGFYMIGLREDQQAFFVGIRSFFYRIAMIAGQGGVVVLAGKLELITGNIQKAWTISFYVIASLFVVLFMYHRIILPKPVKDEEQNIKGDIINDFISTFQTFFKKPHVYLAIAFFLLFRLGEGMLVKVASPFLLDPRNIGGLGLTTDEVGFIYGTIGVIFLIIGGFLGGWVASIKGLKFWILWMAIAMNVPDLVYVYLSWIQPESYWVIGASVAVEQLGYGFGFTAFMLYMIYFAEGKYKTAHFSFATGIMALGMMLPGMISGWIQEQVGYTLFFIIVAFCTIPGFVLIKFLKIDPAFGKKKA